MKISQLRQACQGKNAQTIDNLIRSTDEYQAVASSDDTGEKLSLYAAAVLFLRGDVEDSDSAVAQATEQRKAVNGAIPGRRRRQHRRHLDVVRPGQGSQPACVPMVAFECSARELAVPDDLA
jgi:hypothetical protein